MKDFIISPPFGNFINHHKCTSVVGTYTLNRRGGWIKKLYRAMLTIRPIKNGWINNIGLQNPGITSVKNFDPERVYSIATIQSEEWDKLIDIIPKEITVELNLSCPNIDQESYIDDRQVIAYVNKYPVVIFKLSPTNEIHEQISRLVTLGAKYIHIANTIPTSRGGESGERLKLFSIQTIRDTRSKYPHIRIIGGGGIYSHKDIELYKNAGADYFSLATVWFNPWRATRLLRKF